jgi:ribosomal protein S27E
MTAPVPAPRPTKPLSQNRLPRANIERVVGDKMIVRCHKCNRSISVKYVPGYRVECSNCGCIQVMPALRDAEEQLDGDEGRSRAEADREDVGDPWWFGLVALCTELLLVLSFIVAVILVVAFLHDNKPTIAIGTVGGFVVTVFSCVMLLLLVDVARSLRRR